ncbi:hypothetical protein KIL84_006312, partial [Mauremys mutica]
ARSRQRLVAGEKGAGRMHVRPGRGSGEAPGADPRAHGHRRVPRPHPAHPPDLRLLPAPQPRGGPRAGRGGALPPARPPRHPPRLGARRPGLRGRQLRLG